ncbi:hypothetical protein DID88_008181 [Monilinia fructigena]|uniref:Uncharacterized protein n=1 Tax=Monilinia fructigena TaxID=38457 RepID=A0A395J585_9HELO|nr:hypothetical protein DID88_008181 [Monilinia fructigena]
MAQFIPRTAFPQQLSLPRSYYLGHHASGLSRMKTMLSSIDLIIECRDYRVPLTSRNPLFEQSLAGRERVIVYTKRDLGSHGLAVDKKRENDNQKLAPPSPTLFSNHKSKPTSKPSSPSASNTVSPTIPSPARESSSWACPTGKAAFTGAQPGITRKIASGVKIVDPDPETGTEGYDNCADDAGGLPAVSYEFEGWRGVYREYCGATNDVVELLEGVCRKTGRLGKGGVPDLEAAALWVVQRWRQGSLGRFVLDEVETDGLERKVAEEVRMSVSQARKQAKDVQRMRAKAKKLDSMG